MDSSRRLRLRGDTIKRVQLPEECEDHNAWSQTLNFGGPPANIAVDPGHEGGDRTATFAFTSELNPGNLRLALMGDAAATPHRSNPESGLLSPAATERFVEDLLREPIAARVIRANAPDMRINRIGFGRRMVPAIEQPPAAPNPASVAAVDQDFASLEQRILAMVAERVAGQIDSDLFTGTISDFQSTPHARYQSTNLTAPTQQMERTMRVVERNPRVTRGIRDIFGIPDDWAQIDAHAADDHRGFRLERNPQLRDLQERVFAGTEYVYDMLTRYNARDGIPDHFISAEDAYAWLCAALARLHRDSRQLRNETFQRMQNACRYIDERGRIMGDLRMLSLHGLVATRK